jgi:hypothetical protein
MKKLLFTLPLILFSSYLSATDFYLHANIPLGEDWIDKPLWFDDPTAGSSMGTAPFGGNHFFLNGFDARTVNTGSSSSSFNGSSLNFTDSGDRLHLMAATTNILQTANVAAGDMYVHASRSAVILNIGTLNSSNTFDFRAANADESLDLNITTLAGTGDLIFGNIAVSGIDLGSFSISAVDATGFTGRLVPADGTLTIDSADFSEATLYVDTGNGSKVNIGTDTYFAVIDGVGFTTITTGVYTADELNTATASASFEGTGTISVGIAPPVFPLAITGAVVNGSNEYVLDFTGAPLTDYEVKKSLDLGTFDALTAPLIVTTDTGGVGQATVPASEMGGAKQFFLLEEVAP